MILRAVPLLVFAIFVFGAASCGGGGDESESAPPIEGYNLVGPSREGSLIITRPDGLYEFTIANEELTPLIPVTEPNSYVLDPALSPEATRIAYVVQPPPQIIDGRYDSGSDIWIADRDGSNARMLYKHEEPTQRVRSPRWLDENTVLAIIQVIERENNVGRVLYTLQRIDVTTGERTTLRDDVLAFDISPDRKRIVYARLAVTTGETLHAVDIDGISNPVELVAVDESLAPFNSPDFSPGGDRIAFAAADQNMALPTGQRMVTSQPMSTALDGLPQDIWLIDAEGSSPQLVADLKEDIPALTWGGDGEYIYVLGVNALSEINLDNGAIREIGEGVFHGQIVWAPGT